MIEHRHAKRVALTKKISIYHRGNFVANCKAKNISLDGVALWAGPMQYHRNTMLDVKIDYDEKNSFDSIVLPAIVVHSSSDVLGLMFRQVDEQAQQIIRQLMKNGVDENSTDSLVAIAKGGDWRVDELGDLKSA